MPIREFAGELDNPNIKEFTGELDPEPGALDSLYKAANKLFQVGSVMDNAPARQGMPNPANDAMVRKILSEQDTRPSLTNSQTEFVDGPLGVAQVAGRRGLAGLREAVGGAAMAAGDAFNIPVLSQFGAETNEAARAYGQGAALKAGNVEGFSPDSIVQELPQAAANAGASIIQTAPTLAANVIAPGSGLPLLFAQTGAQEYGQGVGAGLTGPGAALRAIPMGAAEVIGEKLGGFNTLTSGIRQSVTDNSVEPLARALLKSAAREVPGEELTTTLQFLTDKAPGIGTNQDATLADYTKAVKDTALATLLQSGGMAGGGMALQAAADRALPPTVEANTGSALDPKQPPLPPAQAKDVSQLSNAIASTASIPSGNIVEVPDDIQLDQPDSNPVEIDGIKTDEPITPGANPGAAFSDKKGDLSNTLEQTDIAIPISQPDHVADAGNMINGMATTENSSAVDDIDIAPVINGQVRSESGLPQPKAILDKAMQLTTASVGMRPGDIVSSEGAPFATKQLAQKVKKEAGAGWVIKRSNGGFVVRNQPQTPSQLAATKRRINDAANIDGSKDSMFAAIAKLGGISADGVKREWGISDDLKGLRGAGIKRVATRGGMSVDAMGEALAELGYLSVDEHGKYDMHEFEDLFGEELSGSKHFTPEGFENKAQADQEEAYQDYLSEQNIKDSGYDELSDGQNDIEDFINEYPETDAELEERLEREGRELDEEFSRSGRALEADDGDEIPFSAKSGDGGVGKVASGAQTEQTATERTPDAGKNAGTDRPEFSLETHTETDLAKRARLSDQEAANASASKNADNAAADPVGGFTITGSDRAADVGASRGQQSLFSGNDSKKSLTVEQVREAIANDGFGQEVDVYATLDDTPAYVRDQAKKEGVTPEGFFDRKTGRVALIAESLESEARAVEVARHELVGHYGLEGMVGQEEMSRLANRVIQAEQDGNKAIIEVAKHVDRTQPGLAPERRAKEIIAVMAERNVQNSIVRRVIDAIRKFLHSIGIKQNLTDAEVSALLRDTQAYLREQGRAMIAGEPAAMFSANDYQGEHRPPGPDDGAPLDDLTGGGNVYPDDIYGPNGAQYYGHFGGNDPMDRETMSIIRAYKGRPNKPVKIYRAVPYEQSQEGRIEELEKQKAAYLRRNTVPADSPFAKGSDWYSWAGREVERLKALPAEDKGDKLKINSGDWVTINRAYAKDHGEGALNRKYKIVSATVKAKEIFTNGDSIHEFGYWKEGSNGADASFSAKSQTETDFDSLYPAANGKVDGRTVRNEVPNQDSIDSSIDNAETLPGIREVSFSQFTEMGPLKYYSATEEARTKKLAEKIKESGEISPLIVAVDEKGPYILEGGHRFDALRELGAESFPAMVVLDLNALEEAGQVALFSAKPQQAAMNLKPEGIKAKDFISVEKNKIGRKQSVAGRKIYNKIADAATDILGKVKLADNAPDSFNKAMREFRVDQTKAQANAKNVAKIGMAQLDADERKMLSDIIEGYTKIGDMTPESVIEIAASIQAALAQQGENLVELGMISRDRLIKNYLPRAYRNPLLARFTNKDIFKSWYQKSRLRITGARLKSRGLVHEIKGGDWAKYKRLGWKLASMSDGSDIPADLAEAIKKGTEVPPHYPADLKLIVWRDFTMDEREKMGEIHDGLLRYALGYVETQKDIAIGRLFTAIANNKELSSKVNPGGWAQVPDREIPGADGVKQFGALSGMYVPDYVKDAIERNTQPKGPLMAAYDTALNFWKEGKTVWNPVAHGNNIISNVFTAHFAGLNVTDPRIWRNAAKEYRTKGKYYQEAVDSGLFGTEWAAAEIQEMFMPDIVGDADIETITASRFNKVVNALKKVGKPVSFYREKMQEAYQFEDQFFKLMMFIDRRKGGASIEDSINDTERYIFNYADVPEGVQILKRTYSPFFSYTYKAIPMLVHTALTRPDRLIAPIALLGGANWLAYALLGADEDEERKNMPEYMKGKTAIGTPKSVRMPFNVGDRPAFMDMSRRVPLGDLFDMNNQTGGMEVPAPFMPSHPLFTTAAAMMFNKDTFSGKDVTKASDTDWEVAQKRAEWLYKQIIPNAPFVPGSWNFDKLMNGAANAFDTEMAGYTGFTKAGDPTPLGMALLDVAGGTKIRSFDPERNKDFKEYEISKEQKELKANIRSAGRNQAMTPDKREGYIAEQREKMKELSKKRSEL